MNRRGLIIVAVLLALAALAVLVLRALAAGESGLERASAESVAARRRAGLASALHEVGATLRAQREKLLAGASPQLTARRTIGEGPDVTVIELEPFDPADPERTLARSELAQIDARRSDPETIRALLGEGASALLATAEANPHVPLAALLAGDESWDGWSERLTEFAADPAGLASDGSERADVTSAEGRAAFMKLGPASSAAFGERGFASAEVGSSGAFVRWCVGAGIAPEVWGPALDRARFGVQEYRYGVIDVNRAAPESLAALPGLAPFAAEIARARERLSESDRRSPAWPVVRGVIDAEVFAGVADVLVARSLVWRVRIRVSVMRGGLEVSKTQTEAVFDLAGPVLRLAEVRDITLDAASWRSVREKLSAVASIAEDQSFAASLQSPDVGGGFADSGLDSGPVIEEDSGGERGGPPMQPTGGRRGRWVAPGGAP